MSDAVEIALIAGGSGLLTTALGIFNAWLLSGLKKNTDGMQATIERLADAKGQLVGAAQVRSDMQAGADNPLIVPTGEAPPQQVEIVNPKPVPVAVVKDKPADR